MTRGRGRGRRRNSVDHGLIITSMVDMFTLVLLFLLVFYDPAYQGGSEVDLPVGASVITAQSGVTVRVAPDGISVAGNVVASLPGGGLDGSLVRDGQAIVALVEALSVELASTKVADSEGDPVLIVECDKAVPWSVLGPVLESGSRAGFPRYRFLVQSRQ